MKPVGYTQEFISKILKVGTTSIKRWKNQIEESGCIEFYYDTSNRSAPKLPEDKLKEYFESNNDALLKEVAEFFNCTPQAVFYAYGRNNLTYKKRTNFIAGYYNNKVLAPFQYSGTTDSDLVEGWLETYLLPVVPENSVIFMDNASFHRKSNLFDIVEASGHTLIFIPKYSPDLNKIETGLWANMKKFLRN